MRHPLRLLGIAVVGGTLVLSGCGSSDGGSDSGSGSGNSEVAAVIKGLDNPFFQAMEEGINEQAQGRRRQGRPSRPPRASPTPPGQADKLDGHGRAGLRLLHRQPDLRHQPGPGARAARAPRTRRSSTSTARSTPRPRPRRPASTIATYIGTDNVEAGGKAGDTMVERASAAAARSRSSAASPATSRAAPASTASPQAVDGKLERRPDGRRPTGSARRR